MLPCQGVFLGVKVYEVSDYNEHLHAWGVRCTDTNRALNVKSLCSPQLLHARTCPCSLGIEKFISLKHAFYCACMIFNINIHGEIVFIYSYYLYVMYYCVCDWFC